jgi:flagellar M-ring protein FliF
MNRFILAIQEFLKPLNPAQRLILFILLVGVITLFSVLSWWAFQPKYATLLSSLNNETAAEVVRQLDEMNVKYELRDGGATIAVPRDQVYDLRLRIAPTLNSAGQGMGYELFDQNTLGMTDFMQKLNKSRALEGELSRTINSIEQIELSRVHIVMPERSVFERTALNPTVSVFLKIRTGSKLSDSQVEGIASLVAGSIQGMNPENVVILDQFGNRLTDTVSKSEELQLSNANLRIKKEFETYLATKGQSLLDQVLGPGNGVVRVSTDHNFQKVVRDRELVDPETRIVISEERQTTSSNSESVANVENYVLAGDPIPRSQDTQNDETVRQTRNYMVSQTRENIEISAGEVSKIMASVILNYKQMGFDDQQSPIFEPRSDEEINQIYRTIAAAIGIDANRGDELSVTQISFNDPLAFQTETSRPLIAGPIPVQDLIQFGILAVVFIVISILLLKTFKANTDMSRTIGSVDMTSNSGDLSQVPVASMVESKLTPEMVKQLSTSTGQKDQISKFVNENANESLSALRTMITSP